MINSDASNPPSESSPRHTVVVGLGNEIVGDDGVGIWVARELSQILQERTDVEVVPLPWAGFALLDVLVGRRCAAIVDCLCTGLHPPGTIIHLNEKAVSGSVRLNSFHDIGIFTVLELGRKMGWKMPEVIAIWGIEGAELDRFQERLSPSVAKATNQVVQEVLAFLRNNQECKNDHARQSSAGVI